MNPIDPMRRGGAVRSALLGALAGLALAPATASAADECRQKQIASIPARIAPENQLLIEADLNGQPVGLRLDTGLGISALSRSVVQRLGLPIETSHELRFQYALNDVYKVFAEPGTQAHDPGFAGSELTERTRIPRMTLGGAVTEFEEFAVVPIGGDGSDNRPVGVFGNDYLLLYDLELDPAGGKVKLFEQDHCGDRVVYWAREYSTLPIRVDPATRWVTTDVELDGQHLRALIDTGSEFTTLPLGTAARYYGLDEHSPGVAEAGNDISIEGRSVPRYAYDFKSLKLGDLVVGNPRIMLQTLRMMRHTPSDTHIARAAEVAPDIIIGENLLRKLHIYFAFKDSVAYFTLVPPPAPATN
jgi:Aspartyl protease